MILGRVKGEGERVRDMVEIAVRETIAVRADDGGVMGAKKVWVIMDR